MLRVVLGGMGIRLGDGHTGWAQHSILDAVAGLHDLRDAGDAGSLQRHLHEGLVQHRVELVANLTETLHAVGTAHLLKLVGHQLETALEFAMLPGHRHGVQHGHEIGEHLLDPGALGQVTVPIDAPLVVDVLGLQTLQVLGALGEHRLKLLLLAGGLVHVDSLDDLLECVVDVSTVGVVLFGSVRLCAGGGLVGGLLALSVQLLLVAGILGVRGEVVVLAHVILCVGGG